MRKNGVLAAWALILFAAVLFGQDYSGKGRQVGFVFDEAGQPLDGVTVKLFSLKVQQGFETKTDKEGKWVAFGIKGGQWNLDFEKVGYVPKKLAADIQEFARNKDIRVTMAKAEGLVVTDDLKADLIKGNALFDEGKFGEAIAVYQGMLDKNPDAYIIAKNIGNAYLRLEKYDEAQKYYMLVLDKDPQNAEAMALVGKCYDNRGQSDKALEWYNKVDIAKVGDVNLLYTIGTNYYNISRMEDALRYYKKAAETAPDNLDVLYQLGLTYINIGNTAEAIAAFESYLKIDPDSEKAGQVKGFLQYLKK